MPKYDIIHLRFRSGLHLSKGKEGNYDTSDRKLHSDTLKSALFVEALRLYEMDEAEKNAFFKSFQVSSAFPFYCATERFASDEAVYFLPRPLLPKLNQHISIAGLSEQQQGKGVKKIEYFEKDLLLNVLQGKVEIAQECCSKDGKFATQSIVLQTPKTAKSEAIKPIESGTQQHVAVDRQFESDAQPYTVDRIYFHQNAGLYFLLNCEDEATKAKVIASLKLLADTGLATDKHTGSGELELVGDIDNLSQMELPEGGNQQLALSLYCPGERYAAEFPNKELEQSHYKLLRRGGYIASPSDLNHLSLRKRSVYMFSEGSVFPKQTERIGEIVNLQPENSKLPEKMPKVEHAIWRDGRGLFLEFQQQNNE